MDLLTKSHTEKHFRARCEQISVIVSLSSVSLKEQLHIKTAWVVKINCLVVCTQTFVWMEFFLAGKTPDINLPNQFAEEKLFSN